MSCSLSPLDPRGTVLGDEVYRRLGEAILSGELAPGERLRDHDLARRLGVSRTPVREALQRLEISGIVEVIPHRYTRVSIPNDQAQTDTFALIAYLMGNVVHIVCTTGCAPDAVETALADADAMVAASRADDHRALADASFAFFSQLTRAAGNLAILRFMQASEFALRRHLQRWHPRIVDPIVRTARYEEFRDAIAAHDAARAEELLREINGLAADAPAR
ncbi:GntR family transcriptional regulator [Microbacter sp. GSS18]|nr:GntR family transcriptional regulator [Microbacter sp. GSS18]